jgi:hypothetical protein
MNKRLSALAGFLPWGALFLAVSSYKAVQEYDSLFPFHGVTTKPKILVGLLIGGAIPYLTICLWEALAGFLFALIQHRLPKFNRYLQGRLFYAAFHVLPLLPLFLYSGSTTSHGLPRFCHLSGYSSLFSLWAWHSYGYMRDSSQDTRDKKDAGKLTVFPVQTVWKSLRRSATDSGINRSVANRVPPSASFRLQAGHSSSRP